MIKTRIIPYLSLYLTLPLSFPILATTAPLATISDYKPNCITQTFASIRLDASSTNYDALQKPEQSEAFSDALTHLRQLATEQGADTLLLTNVTNHILNFTKENTRPGPSDGRVIKETSLQTHLEAQAFIVCKADKTLSNIRAPFSSDGYKVRTIEYKFTLQIPKTESAATLAQAITLPSDTVSIEEGVYGIKPGMSASQTSERLGPPSIEIQLKNKEVARGYGRSLWFIFSGDRLTQITSDLKLLSGYGRNMIAFRDGFDDTPWKISGVVEHKSPFEEVKQALETQITAEKNDVLLIEKDKQRLSLQFETFHPNSASNPELLFTNFNLAFMETPKTTNQALAPAELTQPQKQWLYNHLNIERKNRPTLDEVIAAIPSINKLNISNHDEQWWLAGNFIQLHFSEQRLQKIKVSESIFARQSEESLLNTVEKLGLPKDKQSLLHEYGDAIDNFDSVDIERDTFTLLATFDSDEETAETFELEIDYY
ncbi:hypothetical protein [Shewanella atlantica]|uniref:DUF2066 domain-containing protein n=1 Tax=Shewanella atlantica TaxID=271099 RepID=A0A431WF23_9GAMM|nr:hypothetical protein [Shewanella atlantica]RTR34160.1 hypothetical protein EKG39_00315 [Shewanella atlantica]